MTPQDLTPAFEKIAAEVEPLVTRLGRAAPGAELETVRDEISGALERVGLRWDHLAERLATPQPLRGTAIPPYAPPPYCPPMPPRAEPALDPTYAVLASDHGDFGYRQRGERLGHAPGTEIPGKGTVQRSD